jgi:acetyl-CoA acyltransferase 2
VFSVDSNEPTFQGICDGAASLVLASEKAVKEQNLTPLARLVSYFTSGVEPSIMGIGPVPAIKGALSRAEKTLDDMHLVEVTLDQGRTV